MDDPGNLIYIAFLIISLIAGWLKNRKKKETEPVANTDQSKPETAQPEVPLFGEIFSNEAKTESAEPQPVASDFRNVKPMQDAGRSNSKVSRATINEVEDIADFEIKQEERLIDNIDLRKAIIYSEILKRPEI